MRTLLSALLLVLGACSSTADDPEHEGTWKEVEVSAPSDRVLWQITLLSLQNLDFPLGANMDPTAGVVETLWKTDLQPFRGEGMRVRALLRFQPLEPGRWKVRARVRREQNMALAAPLDPQRAEWKEAPDDVVLAATLLQHIQSRLKPAIQLSPPEPDPL
jgi:hypothetical protein